MRKGKPPILPEPEAHEPLTARSRVTRWLFWSMIDKGLTTESDWSGKEVTLEGLEAVLAKKKESKKDGNDDRQSPSDCVF